MVSQEFSSNPLLSETIPSITQEDKEQLYAQQIDQIYSLAPIGIIGSLVNGPILTIILWNVISHGKLITWLSSVVGLNMLWCALWYQFHRTPRTSLDSRQWSRKFIGGTVASGLLWGSTGFFLFPESSILHQVFLAFVLGGMIAATTAFYAPLQEAFLAFGLPTATPLVVQFFILGDDLHVAMGVMGLLFMTLMFVTLRRNHTASLASIKLRFENTRLITHLSDAKERAERLNTTLKSEIIQRQKAEKELTKHRDHLEFIVEERTEKLKESETRYRLLAENVTDIIWVMEMDGSRFTYISPSVERQRGYTTEEAKALSLEEVLAPASLEMAKNVLQEELAHEHTGNADPLRSRTLELEHRRKDGSIVWAEVKASFLRDNNGKAIRILGVSRDTTERRQAEAEKQHLEAQLIQGQKMEAIGMLAGGIAHDFNNLLTGILGNVSLAKFSISSADAVVGFLNQVEQASGRARELTQQLLTFAHGGAPIRKLASVRDLLNETASFALSGSTVRCQFSFPDDLWTAEIDEGQISQVIHNLVMNSQQAMPNGGTITIQAENLTIAQGTSQSTLPLSPGPYVQISLADEGIGILKEHLPKIFDPYFTTKPKGHGLGLATSYSIVKKHEGHVTVESERGHGSVFTVFLPACPSNHLFQKREETTIKIGKGKILVMDDETPIRVLLSEMLNRCGYEYDLAKNGAEALSLYKKSLESHQPFSAVILDLTISGGMGGKETIKNLKEFDPHIKAIVSSGYSNDPVMADFQAYGFQGVITKPYNLAKLSQVVYEVVMLARAH